MFKNREMTFECVDGSSQIWRYGPGICDIEIMSGFTKVKNAKIGETWNFKYTVSASFGLWFAQEKVS
jgi:hypothetical protein